MVSHKAISKKAQKNSKPILKTKASSSLCEYMLWNLAPVLNETTGITRSKMLMTLRTISKTLGKTVQNLHKAENVDLQFGSNMAIGCKLNESAGKYTNYEASSPAMFTGIISNVFDAETPSVSAITQKDQRMGKEFEDNAVAFCSNYFKTARYSLEIKPSFNTITSQINAKIFEKVKGRLTKVKCQLEDIRQLEGVALEKITVNEQRSNQKYYAPVLATNAVETSGLSLETFRVSGYAPNPSVKRINCLFIMDRLHNEDYSAIYKNLSSTFPNLEAINLDTNVISMPSNDDDEQISIETFIQPIIEHLRKIYKCATVKTAVKLQVGLDGNEMEIRKSLHDLFTCEFQNVGLKTDDFLSYKGDLLSVNIEVLCQI